MLYPYVNKQSFMLLAVLPTLDQDILVLIAGKYINPINDCERNEIGMGLINELVLAAHDRNLS